MKQGTISVLFGCHSVVHSIIVIITWRYLYGEWPRWWQIVCIMLHDIGHWGKDYLDNYEEKRQHGILGSQIAWLLFGERGYYLVHGHNAYSEQKRSELYEPDKYSWLLAPVWWMYSNTFFEPKLIRRGSTRLESVHMFKDAMRENAKTGYKEHGHSIYLRQW